MMVIKELFSNIIGRFVTATPLIVDSSLVISVDKFLWKISVEEAPCEPNTLR